MFCSAPIQTPIIPVRKSPKYFQVSESGPRGSVSGRDRAAEVVVVDARLTIPPGCQCPDNKLDNGRCLQLQGVSPQLLPVGDRAAAAQ
jgi:hypothetical protein